ncbi:MULTISPECIES: SDR family NAD(P)-dependent oxidoreductase [Streptomycetaceae]|uniref:Short-chain dehydrogenase/reductase SDR n=1 Tax=Streptantibioticus cattleyicolor (strain ATCC 35852 / DSM 46488 / JCM 4925 / NBRC 14057 / NRRL 8057) TaxID=1003195 RepID=F8JU86_STREN|nr:MULTISPECIES: SDR family oxidoreductase [Streptomycetaceae]AEW93101.1 short-chain dehydrogenase/reductase SDR [Streptantibioticus cattleyicolor NRRL 8057 = DSM 46488]MYS57831.1 SDR family oxidoreductase [Streptomyces sp. SID5468]CCB73460.1 conserved exported protein of unknown function [Streptantibioticus cattleyicolor NRRL 8057 = DSM 46488]
MSAARFAGRTVLVTGGSGGIGRAAAVAFAEEGASVVVTGRREAELKETVALIEKTGGRGAAVVADVTVAEDAERMVAETVRRFGGLDVAFNNAGVLDGIGPVSEVGEDAWRRLLDVNLTGVWLSMKYEIAHMKAHGGGTVVNTSSVLGWHRRAPGTGAYAVSKAAVSALTRAAALDHIRDGVRVNAVSPGPMDTTMSLRAGETEADRDARMAQESPIGRTGRLAETVSAVLWLASEESAYTVGHDLVVDGGASA